MIGSILSSERLFMCCIPLIHKYELYIKLICPLLIFIHMNYERGKGEIWNVIGTGVQFPLPSEYVH